jgi:hypothetical protein
MPQAELNVSQSREAATMSSKRVSDQNPRPESAC